MRASLAATAVIMLTGLALTACGGSSNSAATAAGAPAEESSQTLTVNLTMQGGIDSNGLDYCPRTAEVAEIVGEGKKLKMRIVDKGDNEVATTFSDPTTAVSNADVMDSLKLLGSTSKCTVTVTFEDIPLDLDFYTFQADINESNFSGDGADTASLTYSNEEMVKANWTIDATITNSTS